MRSSISITSTIRELLVTMVWPAAAVVSLAVALGGRDVTSLGLLLAASGTAVAYGLDRLIDRRGCDQNQFRRVLAACVFMGAVGTGVLACTSWWRFKVCIILGLIAGAYVPLKRHIPKNILTTFAWTAAIAILPFAEQPPWTETFRASVIAVACIMAANTVLCDIPDVDADRKAGVRGVTPWLGTHAGAVVAVSFGVLGSVIAGSVSRWGLAITAVTLAILACLLAKHPEQRRYRLFADAVVTILPGPIALILR